MYTGTPMSNAFREELMDDLRHPRYQYAALPDYPTSLSWLSVPVRLHPQTTTSNVNVLVNTHKGLACSAVMGVINADMNMDPHGDCTDPSKLVDAYFKFSISAPPADTYPELHADFHLAMSRFSMMQSFITQSTALEDNTVPFLGANGATLSFYHPLFLPKDEVSLCLRELGNLTDSLS